MCLSVKVYYCIYFVYKKTMCTLFPIVYFVYIYTFTLFSYDPFSSVFKQKHYLLLLLLFCALSLRVLYPFSFYFQYLFQ